MKTMKPSELKTLIASNGAYRLIDLREDYEFENLNIGAERIRMSELIDRQNEIPKDIPVIFHCETGNRSKAVVETLERKYNFSNVYSLEGGIQAFVALQASSH